MVANVLKAGDFVRLKSGSPVLSVTHVQEDDGYGVPATVRACWFTRGLYYEAAFPPEVLEPAELKR